MKFLRRLKEKLEHKFCEKMGIPDICSYCEKECKSVYRKMYCSSFKLKRS